MKQLIKKINPIYLNAFIFGVLGVLVGVFISTPKNHTKDNSELIKDFYASEMSVAVSPATLKKWVDTKDQSYLLVDLRSTAEYNTEHFIDAVNIPATSMNSKQIVKAFSELPKDKTIVTHCYSAYCTLARQVGETLSQNDIYVKELNVGWSELRYHWDLWNPGAKVTDGAKYIVKGSELQNDKNSKEITPCTEGEFGC